MISTPFPSPLEVNRFISSQDPYNEELGYKFPSPLEVNRFISILKKIQKGGHVSWFPSPLEVYRFISLSVDFKKGVFNGFRPLARFIGLYQKSWLERYSWLTSFRPLSRYIDLYPSKEQYDSVNVGEFPSPLEVYRFISICNKYHIQSSDVSVPSRGG